MTIGKLEATYDFFAVPTGSFYSGERFSAAVFIDLFGEFFDQALACPVEIALFG
jgi:hypothetical protein